MNKSYVYNTTINFANTESNCDICNKSDAVDPGWIYCDDCDLWFHAKCVNIYDEEFKEKSEQVDSPWIDPKCLEILERNNEENYANYLPDEIQYEEPELGEVNEIVPEKEKESEIDEYDGYKFHVWEFKLPQCAKCGKRYKSKKKTEAANHQRFCKKN